MPYRVDLTDDGHMDWPPVHVDSGKRLMVKSQDQWRKVLVALATKGNVADKSGLASVTLAKRIKWKFSSGAFVSLIGNMQDAGLVTRETRGRRTFSIDLTVDPESFPPEWLPAPATNGAAPVEAPAEDATTHHTIDAKAFGEDDRPTTPVNGADALAAVPADAPVDVDLTGLDDTTVDYSLLATALLERVVDVVVAGAKTDENTYDQAVVLSVQLTNANNQANKLRNRINVLERELAVASGTIKATRITLQAEQAEHRATESNLRRVMDELRRVSANAGMNEDRRKALEKMLREIPISPTTQRNVT